MTKRFCAIYSQSAVFPECLQLNRENGRVTILGNPQRRIYARLYFLWLKRVGRYLRVAASSRALADVAPETRKHQAQAGNVQNGSHAFILDSL